MPTQTRTNHRWHSQNPAPGGNRVASAEGFTRIQEDVKSIRHRIMKEKVISVLHEEFEADIVAVEQLQDFLTITLRPENIVRDIRRLYDHPETQFQFLTTLCGIHYADQKQIA